MNLDAEAMVQIVESKETLGGKILAKLGVVAIYYAQQIG